MLQPVKCLAALQSEPFAQRRPSPAAGSTLFENLPPTRTGINFQLQLPDAQKYIQEIIHLSVYGGICAGDCDGDGLADIYVTSPVGGNRLFRNLGGFRFEDITESAGVNDTNFWGTGATFVDIDNDGDLDLYACGYKTANRLYINQGAREGRRVRFVEQAKPFGLDYRGASMMMAFADMDNDGDLDGYLATTALPPPPGVRFRVTYEGDKPVIPKELREYWSMMYLPGGRASPMEAGQFDHLYRNDGGRFTEVTQAAGIDGPFFTLAALWWDYDADGWPDLYVANDYFGPDMLYRNNRNGTFTNVIGVAVPHTPWSSMGVDIADLNNDGLMDLMATDMLGSTHFRRNVMLGESSKWRWFLDVAEPRQYGRNAVYLNTGAGRVMEAAYQTGLAATDWTWGPRLEDFDNDGKVDVFIANGTLRDVQHADLAGYADRVLGGNSPQWIQFWAKQPMLLETNMAFRNLGGLRFERVENLWGLGRAGVSFGVATADFDNDGNLDLVVSNGDAPLSVYRNRSAGGNSIRVRLKGTASNRFGVGATVRIRTGALEQVRYLTLARAWLSSSEPLLHFGLGSAEQVDSLSVVWPGGRRQAFTQLKANQLFAITEPTESPPSSPEPVARPEPLFVESSVLNGIHRDEAAFDDFSRQPLLPRKIHQQAFAMAWGDADGDGKDDVFVGGSKGHQGRLFLRSADGRFALSPQLAFAADKEVDDVAAVFFDFDADKDLDLFVVTGGGRESAGHAIYRDRLYLNDGKGHFTKAGDKVLPDLRENGRCVSAADFDRDGDVDLFVGAFSVSGQYPLAEPSRLLVNVAGKFIEQTPPNMRDAGLVTDAVWSDADSDGWLDLFLTTEWGPVKLYRNEKGSIIEQTREAGLSSRTGWWNAIVAGDLDQDGDSDYVVANQGLNTRYRASEDRPELLFYGNLDGSGNVQLLEAYFVGDFGYPHRGLDALSAAMPALKERFPSFDLFARAPIEKVFSMEILGKSHRREANTLESGVLLNNGRAVFEFVPLPALAQIAPARDLALVDVDGDGRLDLIMAQNDFYPQLETGRMDGGVSLLLLGNGKGGFEPVPPAKSGILIPEEARRLAVTDLNGDGHPDLVFAVSGGGFRAFVNSKAGK
jgi:hypothetical protein